LRWSTETATFSERRPADAPNRCCTDLHPDHSVLGCGRRHLAREDGTLHSARGIMAAGGSWQDFLRKLLPPIPENVEMRA
jgi:hypothetical protein